MARRLAARGRPWPAHIFADDSLESTSDHLKELARAGAPEWTVVVAEQQTRGHGRHGRPWVSPRGNLYLSVLLRPRAGAAIGLVPLTAGIALVEALAELGLPACLKWPNDVLVGERKIAGILVEAASAGGAPEHAVVGVGVNLDWDPGAHPELAASATSLRVETGAPGDPLAAAAALLAQLALWYDALARDPRALVAAWRARAVAWWGQPVQARSGEQQVIAGRLYDVDLDGALLIDTEAGRVRLVSGEVERVRRARPFSR